MANAVRELITVEHKAQDIRTILKCTDTLYPEEQGNQVHLDLRSLLHKKLFCIEREMIYGIPPYLLKVKII